KGFFKGAEATVDGYSEDGFTVDTSTMTGDEWGLGPYWGAAFEPDEYEIVDEPKPAQPPNPKQAYGDKKVPMHTVPPALVIGAAHAFGEGAAKYGAFNWRNTKVEAMTYVGAIQRHLAAFV